MQNLNVTQIPCQQNLLIFTGSTKSTNELLDCILAVDNFHLKALSLSFLEATFLCNRLRGYQKQLSKSAMSLH